MYPKIHARPLLSIAVIAALNCGSPATFAAERVLEEILVTAQKRAEGLQDIPIAISAISGDEIKDLGVERSDQLGSVVPGLTTSATIGGGSIVNLQIRSVGGGDILAGVESRVGQYFDGVYYGSTVGSMSGLVDLERVEVLRGPQGTLYGRNNTGGAVNYISKKPSGEFHVKQQFTIANFGERRSITSVETPIVENLAARISYAHEEQEAYEKNNSPIPEIADIDIGSFDNDTVRAALRWTPSDTFIADYIFDYTDQTTAPHPGQLLAVGPNSPFFQATNSGAIQSGASRLTPSPGTGFRVDTESQGHSLTLAIDIGDATLKSITAIRETDVFNTGNERDGTVLNAFFTKSNESNTVDQFTQEITLTGDVSDRWSYIAGIFYYDASTDSKEVLYQADTENGPVDMTNFPGDLKTTSRVQDIKSLAVYGQTTVTPPVLNDQLDITLGLRWSDDEKTMNYYDPSIMSAGFTLANQLNVSDSWNSVDPMITLDYRWNEDLSTFIKWSQSYNSGGFNQRARGFVTGNVPLASVTFDEENLEAWELGLKSELMNNRVRLNAVAFFYDYSDQQVNGPIVQEGVNTSFSLINAGKSEISGVEVEVSALLTDHLSVNANYAFLDSKFEDFPGAAPGENTASMNTPAFSPKHSAYVGILYEFDPIEIGQLSYRLGADYRDDMVGANAENDAGRISRRAVVESRTLVNTRLSLSEIDIGGGSGKISLWVNNIFDKDYQTWITDVGALDLSLVTFSEPRSYGIDFTYEF
ncbi:TonB-dependent receptor [Zhongshania aquimaris]|uniref:TonB-dependent receptor n=1 Tax=Zhongshania aquimaris TaxID=2857107 RepID=A0ABS6VNM0_9GAMM|nr:TonB-dependent receptor [Zhongshania aquimaris]MBW2939901.1 TonB-dependent receptor [Zhongshania aquimaris]